MRLNSIISAKITLVLKDIEITHKLTLAIKRKSFISAPTIKYNIKIAAKFKEPKTVRIVLLLKILLILIAAKLASAPMTLP